MPTSARADACYRKMSEEVGARSIFVGRAPVDYRDLRMRQAMPAFRDACAGIKVALDPNGVIAPGRYGIGTP
jgi:4-cresol dehydrogenase (hydroxylating) flavoprotein subunit